jgi:hypothetical protein
MLRGGGIRQGAHEVRQGRRIENEKDAAITADLAHHGRAADVEGRRLVGAIAHRLLND